MHLDRPYPRQLIIESSMLFLWVFSGAVGLVIICILVALWIDVQFAISQEVIGITLLLFLGLFYSLSRLRLPTISTIFDLNSQCFKLKKKRVWELQTVEYLVSEIVDVHVMQKGRFGRAKFYYRIEIELVSGEMVSLSAGNYRSELHVRKVAKELADFLGMNNSSKEL